MTHETEHITDPRTYRLKISTSPTGIIFGWDYPGSTLLRVRIQRSASRFGTDPEQGDRPDKRSEGQTIVYDGTTGSFHDRDVEPGRRYFYTLWARRDGTDEPWTPWGEHRLRAAAPSASARAAARLRLRLGRVLGPLLPGH